MNQNKFKLYLATFLILANAFIWYAVYREDRGGVLTVSFLDVGQGDSIFIDAPNGNQVLLDGGPGKNVLRELGRVMPFYDKGIDLLALSHSHVDHFTGFIDVLSHYSVLGFLSSGTKASTPEYISLKREVERADARDIVGKRDMEVDLGSGVKIKILLPTSNVSGSSPHDGMMVARLTYGKISFLFTGDLEKGLENFLVATEKRSLKSDVLKVGHHGARNSTSESLVGYVNPQYAVISVGEKNMYGHPADEVLDRLSQFGIETLRTDKKGTIIFRSDGEKLTVD